MLWESGPARPGSRARPWGGRPPGPFPLPHVASSMGSQGKGQRASPKLWVWACRLSPRSALAGGTASGPGRHSGSEGTSVQGLSSRAHWASPCIRCLQLPCLAVTGPSLTDRKGLLREARRPAQGHTAGRRCWLAQRRCSVALCRCDWHPRESDLGLCLHRHEVCEWAGLWGQGAQLF